MKKNTIIATIFLLCCGYLLNLFSMTLHKMQKMSTQTQRRTFLSFTQTNRSTILPLHKGIENSTYGFANPAYQAKFPTYATQDYNMHTYTLYNKKYNVLTPAAKCTANQVVFGVLSNKIHLRQNIRDTWGSLACVFFLVAQTDFQTENITKELRAYKDIILLKIPEAYSGWNSALPIKTAAWFTFVYENMHQIQFAVKTDDDSYIRVLPMITHLRRVNASYSGFVLQHIRPIRDKSSQYYTPHDMYKSAEFPPYALGAGYSLSKSALKCYAHTIKTADFVCNEDVATGIIMSLCKIHATHDRAVFADRMFDRHLSFPFTVKHHVSSLREDKLDHRSFFVKIVLDGRLGNHFFKIASAAGIAKYYDAQACYEGTFLGGDLFDVHVPQCQQDNLPVKRVYEIGHAVFRMPDWSNYSTSHNMLLGVDDYTQSFKYFQDLDVDKIFSVKNGIQSKIFNKINNFCGNCTTIGIHVRRTDMLHPNSHFNIPPVDYFQKAMLFMQKRHGNVTFLVASDDISWCEKNLDFNFGSNIVFLYGSKEDDFMALMCCHHMILSVGTFGWWCAFLGSYQRGGDVVYYANEFAMNHPKNKGRVLKEDYYLKNWHKINVYDKA